MRFDVQKRDAFQDDNVANTEHVAVNPLEAH